MRNPARLFPETVEKESRGVESYVLWAFVAVLGLGAGCSGPSATLRKSVQVQHNIRVQASVTAVSKPSGPIELTVNLQNLGTETVAWGQIDGVSELGIRALDSKSELVAMTKLGKEFITPYNDGGKFMPTPIKPGESHEWKVDLARYFVLNPGKYSVQTTIEFNRQTYRFYVSSKRITFRVT